MFAAVSSLPRGILVWLVKGYRLILSPWLQTGCRYEPTCSRYALQALEQHGAIAGSYLTIHRIVRCHPFCDGGHDPIPEHAPRLFRGLVHAEPRAAGSPRSSPLDNQSSP